MRKLLAIALAAPVAATLAACAPSANQTEHAQQQKDSQILVNNQPVPSYTYSQIRQNLIELETAQANGVQTTSFFFNQGVPDPVFSCQSIGSPIPTTDQLTNPDQMLSNHYGTGTVSQMDPNGVYSGDSSGTYVMCVGADGKTYANYWEGYVQTVYAPAKWNAATKQVELIGPASFNFTGHK